MKKKISPRMDLAENEVLRTVADLVVPELTKIFNGCLKTGAFREE